ncbi:hypothetical protein KBY22_08780 [Ruegeria pomeroyi]|uniref:Uncharacterized protein n=1 Tax=Ruegeria alba TaxID=2916756 RepID=A0ABS9NUB4_9RHOB|nr:hypothetical protein [Ruegeria alba]MCE8512784.1 hypothetical protein [Ruegeria pomeroyi]MCE8516447.1 hypothetical protein [Ruegeria pomeroyi]MCE8526045.1 hypothetical protein [Ruegeria pomeroyi]MCE8530330.1 hypothetical protein [Ruegeria pomeroyi]MCE8545524.1 hypothetical protein [Ruegeria pomeroyi]
MIRLPALIVLASLALPLAAQEEKRPTPEIARRNAADAIGKKLANPANPGQARVSRLVKQGDTIKLCATSDARNARGTYIGRDYWEVTLSADGETVLRTRNVTGLLSHCYGADYKPFREMLGE